LKNGFICYQGKINNTEEYLDQIGYKMPEFSNPFDFYIDTVSLSETEPSEFNKQYLQILGEKESRDQKKYQEEYSKFQDVLVKTQANRTINWFLEYYLILKRFTLNYLRNTKSIILKLLQILTFTVIYTSLYINIGSPDKSTDLYQNYLGYFFSVFNTVNINGMYLNLFNIPGVKEVFRREYTSRLYRLFTFYCALITFLLIDCLAFSILVGAGTYWTVGLKTDFATFLQFISLNIVGYLIGMEMGIILGTVMSFQSAFAFAPFLFAFFQIISGFYKSVESLPAVVKWAIWITPYKYFLELYLKLEGDFNEITSGIADDLGYNFGILNCWIVISTVFAAFFIIEFMALRHHAK